MKNAIVKVTDWLVYILLALMVFVAFNAWGVLGALGAFVVGCVLCASWAALSGIYDNSRRSVQLQQQMFDAILYEQQRKSWGEMP